MNPLTEVPSSCILSLVLKLSLPHPPSTITPEGEAQLECQYLIIRIVIGLRMDKRSKVSKITSTLAE